MEKYSEVIGLPVICVEDGKIQGHIKDVIFCPRKREVKAFLLESNRYNIGKKYILLKDILHIGNDAVVINDSTCITGTKKLKGLGTLKDQGNVNGLRIYTRSGQDLGVVTDIIFDYRTGSMDGVEISDGFIQDIVQGRMILPLFGKVEFSDETVIVDKEAVDEMTNTGGGLKKQVVGRKG